MPAIPLWMTRLTAPICMSAHALGILLWLIHGGGPGSAGVLLMLVAWLVLIGFSVIRWLQGDFIQRALNLKPWLRPTDDPLLEQARIAMTRTAFTTLALLGLLMGAMWPTLMDEPSADPEILLKTARFMMAGMSFIGLTGTALPAAIMAWSIPPLEDSETHDG